MYALERSRRSLAKKANCGITGIGQAVCLYTCKCMEVDLVVGGWAETSTIESINLN